MSESGSGDRAVGTRGLSWGHEESLLLIELWSDETVQKDLELAPKSNRHLFDRIRREIQKRVPEFDRTPEECRGRIKRLKRKYYETRKSGGYQLACPYYQELDAVLGSKPIPVGVFEKPHMRPPPPMGPVTFPGVVQSEHAASSGTKDSNYSNICGYGGMDFEVNGGLDDSCGADVSGSNTSRIGRACRVPGMGSKEGRTFLTIRRDTGVYYTDDWKSSGTAIFCPVKQDLYINTSKQDQISATEGGFFTADEQGNIAKSITGHVLHLWRYDKISRKNFISQSFLYTNYEDFMRVQAFLEAL